MPTSSSTAVLERPLSTEPPQRIPSLDGLRAISIAMVLLVHASLGDQFPRWLILPFVEDALGVRIFFVISGFLITLLMIDEEARAGGVLLRSFYRRRFVRILPVFWCYLLTVTLLATGCST